MFYYQHAKEKTAKEESRKLMNRFIDLVHQIYGYQIFFEENDKGIIEYTYVFDHDVTPNKKMTQKLYVCMHIYIYIYIYVYA